MPPFQARNLGVLDRVFDFVGGLRGVSEVDFAGAIQPVLDVSRLASLGARNLDNGYLILGDTDVHVAIGQIFSSRDVYAVFDSVGQINDFNSTGQRNDRLWYIRSFATNDDFADFADASVAIKFIDPDRTFMTYRWSGSGPAQEAGGVVPCVENVRIQSNVRGDGDPVFLPVGTLILGQSLSAVGGTVTVRRHNVFWAGPQGVTPPGMM